MLCTFSIIKPQSRIEAKYDGKWFRNIAWEKHGKIQDKKGGPTIITPWQMEALGNFGTCNQMEVRMTKKETSPCVSTWCIKHEAFGNLELEGEKLS
jgi:hypothetical protein